MKFPLSSYGDDSAWSPYIILTYRLDPRNVIGNFVKQSGKVRTTRGRRIVSSVRQDMTGGISASDYFAHIESYEKALDGVVNSSKMRSIPDTFVIVVGVTDLSIFHQGIYGNDISMADLFEALFHLGFDPLSVIRKRQLSETRNIGVEIRRAISNKWWNKETVKACLNSIGRRLANEIKDYIYGGRKPNLRRGTIERREEKAEWFGDLYQGKSGIYEPLYETGQLFDAIGYETFMFQSVEMRAVLDELKKHILEYRRLESKHHATRNVKSVTKKAVVEKIISAIGEERAVRIARSGNVGELEKYGRVIKDELLKTVMRKRVSGRFGVFKMINIPVNPTQKQLEKIEKRILIGLGLKKYRIKEREENLRALGYKEIEISNILGMENTQLLGKNTKLVYGLRNPKGYETPGGVDGAVGIESRGKIIAELRSIAEDIGSAGSAAAERNVRIARNVSIGDVRLAKMLVDILDNYGYTY